MDPILLFSTKAAQYARYRWEYAPGAIQFLFERTATGMESVVADIGAGTGILTRNFIGRVRRVFAVEPNREMGLQAETALGGHACCDVIAARAEALPLPGRSVDLVTAAQAVQWFEPQAARAEFRRILKPGGWLALLRNYGVDQALGAALEPIYPPECDTEPAMAGKQQPKSFYYEGVGYQLETFSIVSRLNWQGFMGALSTASYAPDQGSKAHDRFKTEARAVFDRFQQGGIVTIQGVTEIILGQF